MTEESDRRKSLEQRVDERVSEVVKEELEKQRLLDGLNMMHDFLQICIAEEEKGGSNRAVQAEKARTEILDRLDAGFYESGALDPDTKEFLADNLNKFADRRLELPAEESAQ